MKNREEYLVSIYSKRDAVLKKRKKNITTAVTGAAAIVLLTVSVAVIPSFTEKPSHSKKPTEQVAASAFREEYVTQLHQEYDGLYGEDEAVKEQYDNMTEKSEVAAEAVPEDATEVVTMIVRYPVTKKHPNTAYSGVDSTDNSGEIAQSDKIDTGSLIMNFINGVTEQPPAAETGGDDVEDFDVTPDSADDSAEYTQDEIISAAMNYLSEDARKLANTSEAFVTVTRTSQGEEYYEVRFDINGTKHKVTLDAENLDMIAVVSSDASATSQVQISPPYIPGQ